MAWKSEEDYEFEQSELQFWNPEIGDSLEGTVKSVKKGQYEKYFLVVEDANGDAWATTQCAAFLEQFRPCGPMDSPIYASTTQEGVVSGIYDSINF